MRCRLREISHFVRVAPFDPKLPQHAPTEIIETMLSPKGRWPKSGGERRGGGGDAAITLSSPVDGCGTWQPRASPLYRTRLQVHHGTPDSIQEHQTAQTGLGGVYRRGCPPGMPSLDCRDDLGMTRFLVSPLPALPAALFLFSEHAPSPTPQHLKHKDGDPRQ